jgi:DNA-directed RNA polymerase specialized sigma24 family protein
MTGNDEGHRFDSLLIPFLEEPESRARDLLGTLLADHVRPVVRAILRRKLRGYGGDGDRDLEGDVFLRLVERLHRLRNVPGGEAIADLRAYAARVTYNLLVARRRLPAAESPLQRPLQELAAAPDPGVDAGVLLVRRAGLRELWYEIRQLPPRQAAALILNLRDADGEGAIALLPLTGTASMREIAQTLEIPAGALAELWNRLPLDDATIARQLGVPRQQVINLRQAARKRLARRLHIKRRAAR